MTPAFRGGPYAPVVGWLALGGTVAGAVVCGILFGFLIPPDRGEEDVVWIMPAYGAFAGFVAVVPAVVGFWVGLVSWTRTSARSVSSRAAVATASASGAALLFWVATVTATTGGYGIVLGLFLGGADRRGHCRDRRSDDGPRRAPRAAPTATPQAGPYGADPVAVGSCRASTKPWACFSCGSASRRAVVTIAKPAPSSVAATSSGSWSTARSVTS